MTCATGRGGRKVVGSVVLSVWRQRSRCRSRTTLESACRDAGFAPRIVAESSDLGVVVALTAEQVGIAVLPRSALTGASGVVRRPLTAPALHRCLLLVSPTDCSPAARAFRGFARQKLSSR
ncbi:LysR substrate-binding domain-containing protein [Micromonospora sp. NPDC048930]|uniref:LysR substrate-binding domain-containing protein n=1 Tax=Micromonospora sp. NPDC048930 TaxID=3364261 RepID=UPI00371D4D3D